MDISALLGTMMSSDALQNIGKTTKTDSDAVKNVLTAALPSLLNGAQAQSDDASTGFAEALLAHEKDDTSDLAAFLSKVDLEDGGKIVGHLLGNNSASEISAIADAAGVDQKDTSNVMSAAAPLLMSLLGQQAASGATERSAPALGSVASLLLKNADVGSLLAGILGGDDKKDEKSGVNLLSILGKILKK